MFQNGGILKCICDISAGFLLGFVAELQISLHGDLKMANFCTGIKQMCCIFFNTPEYISELLQSWARLDQSCMFHRVLSITLVKTKECQLLKIVCQLKMESKGYNEISAP